MIDIITTLKNRANNFTYLVKSLENSDIKNFNHNFIVVDFNSNDIALESILNKFNFNYKIAKIDTNFSRSFGMQVGFQKSYGDKVFFIDADMIVPDNFFQYINNNIKTGQCIFPVCFAFLNFHGLAGIWKSWGYGMCGFTREDFTNLGGWNHLFEAYGYEDTELYFRAKRELRIIRERLFNFYHQWHPNNLKWKTQFHKKEIRKNPKYFLKQNKQLLKKKYRIDQLKAYYFSNSIYKIAYIIKSIM